ncbi:hypothetical protein [Blastococcus sp. SYSU D01042]
MTTRPAPLRHALAVAALALLLPLAACAGTDAEAGDDAAATSSSTPATGSGTTAEPAEAAPAAPVERGTRIEVRVTGGGVAGDTGRVPVAAGEQVTLAITGDTADEVHVHGYDLIADLVPGTPAEIAFTADIPGVFEVELHDAGTVLLTLQVS